MQQETKLTACVHAGVLVRVRVRVRMCVRVHVRVRVRVRACVYACVGARACALFYQQKTAQAADLFRSRTPT